MLCYRQCGTSAQCMAISPTSLVCVLVAAAAARRRRRLIAVKKDHNETRSVGKLSHVDDRSAVMSDARCRLLPASLTDELPW